jgi:release factor glutamine methyltransferase
MKLSEIKALIISEIRHLYDPSEAEAIAKGYIADTLRLSFSKISGLESDINPPEFFYEDIRALAKGSPLQYVTGIQHFSGLEFKVTKAVLIPRPETEELVEWILDDLKLHNEAVTVIDIGTGSGCIPVLLKLRHPKALVYATDISPEALKVASENASKHQVEIIFRHESILNPADAISGKYDFIISNPPYIPFSESKSLAANVLDFEPHSALFSPDDDPILFYKAICDYAVQNLKIDGGIYLEINPDFSELVIEYLKKSGFDDVITKKDMSDRLRFLKATRVTAK